LPFQHAFRAKPEKPSFSAYIFRLFHQAIPVPTPQYIAVGSRVQVFDIRYHSKPPVVLPYTIATGVITIKPVIEIGPGAIIKKYKGITCHGHRHPPARQWGRCTPLITQSVAFSRDCPNDITLLIDLVDNGMFFKGPGTVIRTIGCDDILPFTGR